MQTASTRFLRLPLAMMDRSKIHAYCRLTNVPLCDGNAVVPRKHFEAYFAARPALRTRCFGKTELKHTLGCRPSCSWPLGPECYLRMNLVEGAGLDVSRDVAVTTYQPKLVRDCSYLGSDGSPQVRPPYDPASYEVCGQDLPQTRRPRRPMNETILARSVQEPPTRA